MLAPDVVLVTDGGGVKRRPRSRPILGRDKVLRFLAGVIRRRRPPRRRPRRQRRARAADPHLTASSTRSSSFGVEDGLVTGLYVVRNPAKLARLEEVAPLTR